MAFQGNWTKEFSSRVLRQIKMPIKTLAHGLGVSYKTLWNWIEGLYAFPPDLISKLYEVTKDRRVFDFFLHQSGFVALEDPQGKARKLIEKAMKGIKDLWEFLDYDHDRDNDS